jgi:peptidyl-dipeptidase A
MEVKGILSRSDLYEKEGKSPHAFCTSIDRDQDVRVLCNVKPNANWMDTVHHEIGHAVYDQYIAKDVPFILHEPSHILTTEGIAMLFGSITKNEEFISKVIGLPESEVAKFTAAGRRSLRAEKLIFSRWTQVMLRFEQAMYRDPDQDLNKLWWSLKKRYQLLNPPNDLSGSDYGAKLHIVAAPVYYHNYMLGELFATQLHSHIAKTVIGAGSPHETGLVGSKKAGRYLREKVFEPGNLYRWDDLTRRATGEPLSAKAFAEQYVR